PFGGAFIRAIPPCDHGGSFTNRVSVGFRRGACGVNALAKILDLSTEEKVERGLLYTPAEIAQQPATWESTFSLFQKHRTGLAAFLVKAGFGDSAGPDPTVFLI